MHFIEICLLRLFTLTFSDQLSLSTKMEREKQPDFGNPVSMYASTHLTVNHNQTKNEENQGQ